MPVYPEFQGEGDAGQAFNAGQGAGMSMMERAQQMEQRGELAARQRQMFDMALPAIQAKQQADVATAHAAVGHVAQMQNLRTKGAQVFDTANAEFQAAQQLADFNAQSSALAGLQAKYSWMDQLPEYKGFVNAINNARVTSHDSAMKDMALQNQLDIAKINTESRERQTAVRTQGLVDASTVRAGATVEAAGARTSAPTALMKEMQSYTNAIANGDDTVAGILEAHFQAKSGMAPTKIADSLTKMADNEEKLANAAKQNGDDATYQLRLGNVDKLRNRADTLLQQATTPQATPTTTTTNPPVAPTRISPTATTIDIGGKSYPVLRNKAHPEQRGYMVDGHIVPLQTEE